MTGSNEHIPAHLDKDHLIEILGQRWEKHQRVVERVLKLPMPIEWQSEGIFLLEPKVDQAEELIFAAHIYTHVKCRVSNVTVALPDFLKVHVGFHIKANWDVHKATLVLKDPDKHKRQASPVVKAELFEGNDQFADTWKWNVPKRIPEVTGHTDAPAARVGVTVASGSATEPAAGVSVVAQVKPPTSKRASIDLCKDELNGKLIKLRKSMALT